MASVARRSVVNAHAWPAGKAFEITNRCWDVCMTGTVGSKLEMKEKQCFTNCTERFVDTAFFVRNRFVELQRRQLSQAQQ
jgi:hypothetical protein